MCLSEITITVLRVYCAVVDAYIWVCQGLLSFLSEAEKSILLNGFAVGLVGFQTELRELMHIFGFARVC